MKLRVAKKILFTSRLVRGDRARAKDRLRRSGRFACWEDVHLDPGEFVLCMRLPGGGHCHVWGKR